MRRGNLSPKLNWHLSALEDRLEKPGRERLSVAGALSRAGSPAEEVTAVWEFPDRLRLTRHKGNQTRVIAFDGDQVKAGGNPLDEAEQDLMETLVYGSAEHFFDTQMEGMGTRFLGSRFRLDDGSSADYSGPYYDVYKVADQVKTSPDQREQLKLYYFNSETLLLERVTYEINRNGATVKVEERLGDWTKEQGQQVARRIERFGSLRHIRPWLMTTSVRMVIRTYWGISLWSHALICRQRRAACNIPLVTTLRTWAVLLVARSIWLG